MKTISNSRTLKLTIVAACLFALAATSKAKQTLWPKMSRRLTEKLKFQSQEFYDVRTTNMKSFLESKRVESEEYNKDIKINTQTGPDGSITSGNADSDFDFDKLVPQFK